MKDFLKKGINIKIGKHTYTFCYWYIALMVVLIIINPLFLPYIILATLMKVSGIL